MILLTTFLSLTNQSTALVAFFHSGADRDSRAISGAGLLGLLSDGAADRIASCLVFSFSGEEGVSEPSRVIVAETGRARRGGPGLQISLRDGAEGIIQNRHGSRT